MLLGAIVLICAVTLFPEPGGVDRAFRWRLTFARAHLVEDLLNAVLFAPLGVALARLGQPIWRGTAASAALSIAIELGQLHVIAGRYAELQDILANTIGGLLGSTIAVAAMRRNAVRSPR